MTCDHRWYWRRKRNKTNGYWECVRCGMRTDHIGLDENGRAAEGPPTLK